MPQTIGSPQPLQPLSPLFSPPAGKSQPTCPIVHRPLTPPPTETPEHLERTASLNFYSRALLPSTLLPLLRRPTLPHGAIVTSVYDVFLVRGDGGAGGARVDTDANSEEGGERIRFVHTYPGPRRDEQLRDAWERTCRDGSSGRGPGVVGPVFGWWAVSGQGFEKGRERGRNWEGKGKRRSPRTGLEVEGTIGLVSKGEVLASTKAYWKFEALGAAQEVLGTC
ncbi:MAG: hypothetical protein LQ340_004417 [Diploschistes diacapsis]|nr:MAG: hypothetical protein LQ340_004417 [Diploschistes diacapsis]